MQDPEITLIVTNKTASCEFVDRSSSGSPFSLSRSKASGTNLTSLPLNQFAAGPAFFTYLSNQLIRSAKMCSSVSRAA